MVRKTGVVLKKIWKDEQFFEINFEVRSPFCNSNMNFYTTNAELVELMQGLLLLSSFKQDEYVWQSGEDTENISHYVYTKWFLQDKLGHMGLSIVLCKLN